VFNALDGVSVFSFILSLLIVSVVVAACVVLWFLYMRKQQIKRTAHIMESTPMAVIMYDHTCTPVDCNRYALELWGVDNKENFIKNYYQLMPTQQDNGRPTKDMLQEYFATVVREGYVSCRMFDNVHTDGTAFMVEFTMTRIPYRNKFAILEFIRDVTVQVRTRRRVDAQNNLARQFLDNSPMYIILRDAEGHITYCNQNLLNALQADDMQDFITNYLNYAPQYQPCGALSSEKMDHFIAQTKNQGSARFEWTLQTQNGELLPVDFTYVHVESNSGPIYIGYSHDLRPVKAAMQREHALESQLRERAFNTRLQLILDHSPISVTCYSAQRVAIDCNKEAVRLYGFDTQEELVEALSQRFYDYSPELQPNGARSDALADPWFNRAQEDGVARFKWVHLSRTGEELPVMINLVRVDYDDTYMFISYLRDLREEIANEAYTHALYDATPLLVEIWDEDLSMIECNTQFAKTFGIENREDVINDYLRFSPSTQPCGTPSKDKITALLTTVLHKGSARTEWMHCLPNGEELPAEVVFARLNRQGRHIIVGYSYDLRPIKLLEKQRIDAAEEANRAKSRFLARMSHEIRTPLTAILGISEMQLRVQGIPPGLEEAFAKIYDSSNTLLHIVNDILDFSKIESGKMDIIAAEYCVPSLIADATQLFAIYAEHKPITFVIDVDENLPKKFVGDAMRIRQIINNLLSNAFKYTDTGAVTLSLEYENIDNTPLIIIEISDTGMGMSEAQLNTAHTEYIRLHETERPFVSGTGLGIPIVHNLAQLMNAKLEMRSNIGFGTTVTLRIPQQICDAEPIGFEYAQSLQNFEGITHSSIKEIDFTDLQFPNARVMVVDDVETNLYVAESMLQAYGITPDLVNSGAAALDKIRNGAIYDIIFMDHMMPEPDGIETTKTLRAQGYTAPIVALTANAVKGQAELFVTNGFDGFMTKPIDMTRLNAYLVRFLRKDAGVAKD